MKKHWLFIFSLAVMVAACKKDPVIIPDPDDDPIVQWIQSDINGLVLDENAEPMEGAQVSFGGKTAATDARGYFRIFDATVRDDQDVVRVEKAGYFSGFRTLTPRADGAGFVQVQLLPLTIQATLNAQSGGQASADGGKVKLDFPADAIVRLDGTPYIGDFGVAIQRIDPTAANIADIMPGNLTAENADGDLNFLKSFGMVAVELIGSGGEELQVAAGKQVTWSQEIPASLMGEAPAAIDLWHFDEETGLWVEEGSAAKQGSFYVGEVSHFSFWNCDVGYPLVEIEIPFLWKGGDPLSNHSVKIIVPALNLASSGYLYANGFLTGMVIANQELVIEIYDACDNLIYSGAFGPFAEDTVLPPVYIDPDVLSGEAYTIQGQAVDCNGDAVQNGYVYLETNGSIHFLNIDNGVIEPITVYLCNPAMGGTATAYDLVALQESQPTSIAFGADPFVDLGTLNVCGEVEEYFQFFLDGVETVIVGESVQTFADSSAYVQGYGSNQQGGFLSFEDFELGVKQAYSCGFNSAFSSSFGTLITVEITQTGLVGDPVEGTFNGSFQDWQGGNHTVGGSFRAILWE